MPTTVTPVAAFRVQSRAAALAQRRRVGFLKLFNLPTVEDNVASALPTLEVKAWSPVLSLTRFRIHARQSSWLVVAVVSFRAPLPPVPPLVSTNALP